MTANQVGDKGATQVHKSNATVQDVGKSGSQVDSKLYAIKEAIENNTYQLNLMGSAEKMAQELLGGR